MDRQKFEQRCSIEFCVKLGESATVTYEKLQRAYGEHFLSRAQVFRWNKPFLEGREQVEDEPRAGRTSVSKTDDNVERVRSLVRSDRRLTLRKISSELNLNRFTVPQILTQDLDMRKVCAKMVPKNLTTEQKANRRGVCLDLLDRLEREPEFFSRVITGDESWILEYDPETKRRSRQWHTANSRRPKKAGMNKSKIKSMLICFFDSQVIVHKEFVPPGQTVNQTFYREVLERLRKRVARVRPSIARTWMLHHDNAPCNTAISINEFLVEKSIPIVPQPPYSPDLSPCDFFLFPRLKNYLKGCRFCTLDSIQKSVTDELKGIPTEAFQHCYEQWKQRLRRCVAAQWNYFEGDNLDL